MARRKKKPQGEKKPEPPKAVPEPPKAVEVEVKRGFHLRELLRSMKMRFSMELLRDCGEFIVYSVTYAVNIFALLSSCFAVFAFIYIMYKKFSDPEFLE
ncbi:unnamed protein product [Litomosoides sigmodontis]|uniref:Uncharacterized protein n=1 Tax=Litomosoides sigmodontis TaxID=42156 RepID=A0A3P6U7V1_LITSI|nr:unnamed protein product [Litomosoides sigmodontis]